jgi:hypothetical protein
MQNQGMQPIDLVKHQSTVLPGLEEALHYILGRLNESRKLIDRAPLILIEDPEAVNRLYRERKARRDKAVIKAWRDKQKKTKADDARGRIAMRSTLDAIASDLGVSRTKVEKTLVKRRRA